MIAYDPNNPFGNGNNPFGDGNRVAGRREARGIERLRHQRRLAQEQQVAGRRIHRGRIRTKDQLDFLRV